MTNGSSDRLDLIENMLQETVQITQLNSRTIQGILDTQTEARLEREEFRYELAQTTANINEAIQRLTTLNDGVVNLLSSLDSDSEAQPQRGA